MLTSNLQKNYEMQLIILNGKKDWLKNSDLDQIKKIEEDKSTVFEKLKYENMKLRDDSYFFKEQQDKALREKHTHLLFEEKSNIDMLDALKQLQNGLFEQDQNISIKNNNLKELPQVVNKELANIELNRIKSIQKEIDTLMVSLKAIEENMETLKANGIASSIPIEKSIEVTYYKNPYILKCFAGVALFLFLLSGLIFGPTINVTSAKVVESIFGAPLLGIIPELPNEGLENAKHKKFTDAIDLITDSIYKKIQDKEIKSLNILSPKESEGRTQLAGMLSLSFNLKKNMKIIALDTCFNNPKLADFLELKTKIQPDEEGLTSYFKHLVETKEISETDNNQWLAKLVKPCIRNGIFVISPGYGTFSDVSTFNSRVIITMFEGIGKYVDLIIADTPPLNSNLNFVSKVLAENTAGNILLIKKGAYKKKDLEAIKKNLAGIWVLWEPC